MKKFMVVTDTHGDERNKKAVDLAFEFMADFKPEIRIHLGDWMDARALRSGAAEHEKRSGLRADKNAAFEFLERYRPTLLLDGNHDIRVVDSAANSTGPISDYCGEIREQATDLLRKFKTQHLPYDKRLGVAKIGKMKLLHGFFAGQNAPQMHARAYGSCIFGHTHRFSSVSVPGAHSGNRAVARGVGALCNLDMPYNRAMVDTLSQAQGWGYGVMDDKGRYWMANAEIVDGKVAIFDSFKILG